MTDGLDPTQDAPTPAPTDATTRVEMPTTPGVPLTPAGRENPAATSYEHEVAWAAVAPAAPVVSAAAPRRRSRFRWAVSIALVALIIATTAAVAAIISGRSSDAIVLGYVPDHTTMYGEVRLDLPGDQRRAVGEFLSRFPGFADQSALESKLDQVLDDLVKNATDGSQTYTTDIKPWFGGELASSLGPLPPASGFVKGDPSAVASLRTLALISITDPTAAGAWFDAAIAKTGAKTTTEPYDGATLTLFEETDGLQPAVAIVDGKVVVAGDLVSVKAAIDTKGAGGFANEPGPKAAFASMTGDHVGFAYLGLRPLVDWSTELSGTMSSATASPALSATLEKVVPDWGAFALRFQNDAVVMEATSPVPETRIGPTENRRSTIAEHIPSSAFVASISNDLGATLKQTLALYRAEPSLAPMLDQLDKALGLVGGADAALGWAGDSAIVVNATDGTPEGGLVVVPTDKAAADHLFTALRSFLALGGAQQGVTVSDETYNGTTITKIDLGDIGKLAGMAGSAGATGLPTLPSGHVEIAYAVTDQIVVIGSGPAFVKHVLDTTKDTSLAADDRYTALVDRAGNGTGSTWVDITAIRGLIEKAAAGMGADPAALAKYESDIKPFLAPFDAMYSSMSTGSDLSRSVIYITVK
jgi:hypothetical protein